MRQTSDPSWIRRHRWSIANAVLAPFGRACVRLGEWPHRAVVEMTIAALRDAGGEVSGEGGTPAGEVRNIYLKLRGCRLRLCVEDYAEVTLWGPKKLVHEVSRMVAAKTGGGSAAA